MEKQGLGYQREMEMTLFYEGIDSGTRRVDFFFNEISKQISLVNEQLEETRTFKKVLLSKLF